MQLLFFAQLFNLLSQSEKIEREEENRVECVRLMDSIVMEFGSSWTALVCTMLGSQGYELQPETYRLRMNALLTRLETALESRDSFEGNESLESRMAIMRDTRRLAYENYLLFQDMHNTIEKEAPGDSFSQAVSLGKLKPRYLHFFDKLTALKRTVQHEVVDMTEIWKGKERKQAELKRQIAIAIIADFSLTALFIVAFLLNITNRLKVLVANASLLPTDEKLNNHVTGSDELAMLDAVLHDASIELRIAKEHRKSLMEMVAHDLRSPLSSAKSTVDILLNRSADMPAEDSQALLSRLRRSLARLISLVEDLLTIERLESGKLDLDLSNFKVQNLIDECFESLAATANAHNITLVKEGADLDLIADEQRIQQVIMNLLSNAIKYSPDNSTVKLTVESEKNNIKVSISDQGAGISKEDRKMLFQKFVQSEGADQKEGFGLGLAICKLIIEQHHGRIGVTSEPGNGSTFFFTLPNDSDDEVD